ncbi:MAG: DUF1801 domain-containing protein [Chitinophagales bacterium]|nr:DUF1801 domain-containing protein [Bacteroidota bacterium]MCB9042232.1 DUF1801 domain-containing protein [Chitinophagales bacterium]
MPTIKYTSIDHYLSDFPQGVATKLEEIRQCIQTYAPKASETISYNMPAFKWQGKVVVYFAAYKNHIGFYALPKTNTAFATKLKAYKTSKGAIQFPLTEKIPLNLVREIVSFRIAEIENSIR